MQNDLIDRPRVETPAWLREGKFGIYTHWGVYAVHACGPNTTWYSNALYLGREAERAHFEAHFGPFGPNGYTDLIPRFTASRFDPDEWAELFRDAGARFAGPVAMHHDGFAMWKSAATPFNAWDMGPHRDVVGELEKSFRAAGLRFMTAFHHAENYWFLERMPGTDAVKPENEYLFSKKGLWPYEKFCRLWYRECDEVFTNYRPDLIWFDFGLRDIPDVWKRKMIRRYLETAAEAGIEPALCYKNHDLIPGSGLIDLELGRFRGQQYHDWITDTTADAGQAWGYMENAEYKTGADLVRYLVDNVSKNGYMLLNVGPRADGTFPEEVKRILQELGGWLRVNGEAIYGTCPWYAFGEGRKGGDTEGVSLEYEQMYLISPEEVRYTAKEDSLYALLMGRPDGEVVLHEVAAHMAPGEIVSVSLLGHGRPLPFRIEGNELRVAFPADAPEECVYALKIARDPLAADRDE